jgi:peptide/nickel transport system substrate-binding protein
VFISTKRSLFIVIAGLILFTAGCSTAREETFSADQFRGPKIKDLYMVIIRDPDAQVLAIEKGDIHILGDITRPVDVERLCINPKLDLSLAQAFHGFFLGFNLRKSPWNRKELRQAAWMAIPREKIVRDLFSGYAAPLASFLPPASPYYAEDLPVPPQDLEGARSMLEKNGWSRDSRGILIPPGSDTPLETMKLLSPTAQVAPTTAELVTRLVTSLNSIGIPLEVDPMDFSTMIARLNDHDFDSYVLAWSMTRDPDSLFAFYHSSMDIKGGYNIPGIHDAELDRALETLRQAPDETSAREAAELSQRILADRIPVIPIYSRYSIASVSKQWKDSVTTKVTTADNIWSLLNMEPSDGVDSPLYWCLAEEPRALNPFSGGSAYDWQVMGILYDSLLSIAPDSLEDIPWLAREWKVETLEEEGRKRTRLTFSLRDDVLWQDGEPFTGEDVKATIEFMKSNSIPRYLDNVRDVMKVDLPDKYTVQVTMKGVSYWYLHNIGGLPIVPEHIIRGITDWKNWQPSKLDNPVNSDLTQLTGTGPFIFREYRRGEYVRFSRNDHFWLLHKDD